MAKQALMRKSEKSERIALILGKKCALMHNKCKSCKKNMQEFSRRFIQPICDKCTKYYSNFVLRLIRRNIQYFVVEGIRPCLGVSSDPMYSDLRFKILTTAHSQFHWSLFGSGLYFIQKKKICAGKSSS